MGTAAFLASRLGPPYMLHGVMIKTAGRSITLKLINRASSGNLSYKLPQILILLSGGEIEEHDLRWSVFQTSPLPKEHRFKLPVVKLIHIFC